MPRMMACRWPGKIKSEMPPKGFDTEHRSNGSGTQENGWVLEAAFCDPERRSLIRKILFRPETAEAEELAKRRFSCSGAASSRYKSPNQALTPDLVAQV